MKAARKNRRKKTSGPQKTQKVTGWKQKELKTPERQKIQTHPLRKILQKVIITKDPGQKKTMLSKMPVWMKPYRKTTILTGRDTKRTQPAKRQRKKVSARKYLNLKQERKTSLMLRP